MTKHFDSKPDQVRWTDEEILAALEEMNKRTPSGAHSAVAVMRMMRDSYEITRQSANRYIAELEASRVVDPEMVKSIQLCAAGIVYAFFRKTHNHIEHSDMLEAKKVEEWLEKVRKESTAPDGAPTTL